MTQVPLGERIRILRRRRGMTQVQLAGLVGRSVRWMVQVEAGEVDLRMSEVVELARALTADPVELTSDHFDAARAMSEAAGARSIRAGAGLGTGTLVVEREDAHLRYEAGFYHLCMRRQLHNAGDTPVTRYLVKISIDLYPGDPERSNRLYRDNPLTWQELQFAANCAGAPMTWKVKDDRDAVKELYIQFESPDGRRFPLYPGEKTTIEYSYSVSEEKWGRWFQRAVRWPTRHLAVELTFPTSLDPVAWGTETSVMADSIPLRTPMEKRQAEGMTTFAWSVDDPPLHTRYRLEWTFRRQPPT